MRRSTLLLFGTGVLGLVALLFMMHYLLAIEVQGKGRGRHQSAFRAAFADDLVEPARLTILTVPGGEGIQLLLRVSPRNAAVAERLPARIARWIRSRDFGPRPVRGALLELRNPLTGRVRSRVLDLKTPSSPRGKPAPGR